MFTKLFSELHQRGHEISDEQIIQSIATSSKTRSYFKIGHRENIWQTYIEDIRNAKKKISIEIPGFLDEDEEYLEELTNALEEARDREVIVKIKYDDNISIPYELETFGPIAGYAATPLTLIDKHIIWFHTYSHGKDFFVHSWTLPVCRYFLLNDEGTFFRNRTEYQGSECITEYNLNKKRKVMSL